MKKIFFLCMLHFFTLVQAGFFGLDVLGKRGTKTQFLVNQYEEKKHKLEALHEELIALENGEKEFSSTIKSRLDIIVKEERELASQKQGATSFDHDYFSTREVILQDIKQSLNDIQQAYKQVIYCLKKNIEVLEQYIANPSFNDLRVSDKASYQFNDFQNLSKQLLSAEAEFNSYRDEKKRLEDVVVNSEQQLEQFEQELKKKEKEQKSFSPNKLQDEALELRQKSDVIDWEIQLLKTKIENQKERRKVLQKELDLVNLNLFVTKIKIDFFRKDLAKIDRKLWVNEAEVQRLNASLDEQRKIYSKEQAEYNKSFSKLSSKRDEDQKLFDVANKKLPKPIQDVRQLSERLIEPASTGDEAGFYNVALLNDLLQVVDRNIVLLEANLALSKTRVMNEELQLEVMKTWLTITQRRSIYDEPDRQQQLNYFLNKKAEIDRQLEEYKNKDAVVTNLMSIETRALTQVKGQIDKAKTSKNFLDVLNKSQEQLNKQLDLNGQLIKVNSTITTLLMDMKRQADMVIRKLESISGIWQRSVGAITWEGIKSTGPDLRFFWDDLINIASQTSFFEIRDWFADLLSDTVNILNFIIAFLLLAALYFLLAMSLPLLHKVLVTRQKKADSHFIINAIITICSFLRDHLLGIFIWSVFFSMVRYEIIVDVGIHAKILFYLLSIPYLCYLSHIFVSYFIELNKKFMSVSFQNRFTYVFQFFLFSTVIILFFREAFIITTYGHSELPTILLAIYSIITRASLVFLILTKELILDALPSRGKIWSFIKDQIDYYYAAFLIIFISLIVMSDPFVGYGRLVSLVLQGTLWTLILIAAFWWIQNMLKRYSSALFFTSTGEGVRERFSNAKTWYGLFIVVSFAVLIILVAFFFAKIWGYPVSLERITNFLNFEIAHVKGEGIGETIPITIRSIMLLISFIFGGFFLSSVFKRYVLERIYTLLQVDAGVQNTISRISGYLIVFIIVIIGFQRVGLSSWIPVALGALALGFAFAIKGPADDFVAYFIILVERFIKIGDYIRLENVNSEVSGIVRKITPRSVILRKKNGYSIIIPNSRITKIPILNWNYTRGYFAFEDMNITVSYKADPLKIKEIFLKILDENSVVLKSPAPVIRITSFSLSGYEFMIRGFLSASNVLNQWDIRSDIRFAIAQEFKKNKIKFAVPVRDVNLEKMN